MPAFPFFALPSEIRNLVYSSMFTVPEGEDIAMLRVLPREAEEVYRPPFALTPDSKFHILPAYRHLLWFTHTSRQARHEAGPMFMRIMESTKMLQYVIHDFFSKLYILDTDAQQRLENFVNVGGHRNLRITFTKDVTCYCPGCDLRLELCEHIHIFHDRVFERTLAQFTRLEIERLWTESLPEEKPRNELCYFGESRSLVPAKHLSTAELGKTGTVERWVDVRGFFQLRLR